MELITNPERNEWAALLSRPVFDPLSLEKQVSRIMNKVRKEGDKAVRKFTKEFDGVRVKELQVSQQELNDAVNFLTPELREAILLAAENIRNFHRTQIASARPIPGAISTLPLISWISALILFFVR